ncbi:hypothetical protein ACTXHA_28745 [Burkholderia cenocepacia]
MQYPLDGITPRGEIDFGERHCHFQRKLPTRYHFIERITRMEMPILIAMSAAAGAVGGAAISAVTNFVIGRQASRQRRREQLIERAYEAGMAEFRMHIEIHRANAERGDKSLPLLPANFISFHLAMLDELTDFRRSPRLDPDAIARAFETAALVAGQWEDGESPSVLKAVSK